MAATFTRDVFNDATHNWESNPNAIPEVIAPAGTVLSVQPYSYHVPSDNAMIDSGNGRRVSAFIGGRVVVREFGEGRPLGGFYTFDVDATADVIIAAAEWQLWENWFSGIRHTIRVRLEDKRRAAEVGEGKRVRIVKGRKVPQGTEWYVHRAGNGDFGPYVHLSSEPRGFGQYHKFVNPENCQVVSSDEVKEFPFPILPTGEETPADLLTLGRAWNALDRYGHDRAEVIDREELALLRALADACEEAGCEHGARVFRRAVNG